MAGTKIGELNGPWALMLKLTLATYPLLIVWASFITANQIADNIFRGEGERFTKTDGAEQTKLLRAAADSKIASIESVLTQMRPANDLVPRDEYTLLMGKVIQIETRMEMQTKLLEKLSSTQDRIHDAKGSQP